jgi:superfamily II DNA or RNA helicase
MKDYTKVRFNGEFRHYQQSVIDNSDYYLRNGKIHIVAAPGSGKTTLGLELIRRLNKPALILSPSITIRGQWGKRFEDGFLDLNENISDYFSYNLKELKLINSITYQGLHSALNKLIDKGVSDNDTEDDEADIDYSNFELIKELIRKGVKTVCLDEAHHLRNEWYNSLMKVINNIGEDVIVISLTATPPYDSTPLEWEKYINLCGVIDDEIFVPELIQKRNLCPHQDFIYFNYPTNEEQALLNEYHKTASLTLDETFNSEVFRSIMLNFISDYNNEKYNLYENIEYYITLGTIAGKLSVPISRRLKNILKGRSKFDKRRIIHVEALLEFIISNPNIFGEDESKYIKDILYKNGLIERRKVFLNKSSPLKKRIISSIGKLDSIAKIAEFESESLGQDLKMLILTDYIKKDQIDLIGSNLDIKVIGAIPIFEKVRQNVSQEVRLCLLSGTIVIYPNIEFDMLDSICKNRNIEYTKKELANVPYSIIDFKSSNRLKVDIITEIFESGNIDIIIGTKSLLGEGWDSPSINTLILASFVGSYMLSNQMRGRAIRIDPTNPEKVANIWHLATVERNIIVGDKIDKLDISKYILEDRTIVSADYNMLNRRFDAFLGPSYSKDYVSSGIERLDYIEPPYNQKRFMEFNEIAKEAARNREDTRDKWLSVVDIQNSLDILDQAEIKPEVIPYGIIIYNLAWLSTLSIIVYTVCRFIFEAAADNIFALILGIFIILVYSYFVNNLLPKILLNIGPNARVKNLANIILKSLKNSGEIESLNAKVVLKKEKNSVYTYTSLSNATRHEKAVFSNALKELLSPIDNPRYIVIKYLNFLGIPIRIYSDSFAVPKVFGVSKDNASILVQNMKRTKGNYELLYTRSELGRKALLKCKRNSRVTSIGTIVLCRRVVRNDKQIIK